MIYKTSKSLDIVRAVARETDVGLSDHSRTIKTSAIKSLLLANATGAGAAATCGLAALIPFWVPVLTLPFSALAIASICGKLHGSKRKLTQEKEALLQEVVRKQAEVIRQLEKELDVSKERNEYLTNLNALLQKAIHDLKSDLS